MSDTESTGPVPETVRAVIKLQREVNHLTAQLKIIKAELNEIIDDNQRLRKIAHNFEIERDDLLCRIEDSKSN